MRGRDPFPRKKSPLTPVGKTVTAARVLLDVMDGKLDEKTAGISLRSEVRLNWSVITIIQYLSGQEAIAAWRYLPEDWEQDGFTRADVARAILVAANAVNNARSDGQS